MKWRSSYKRYFPLPCAVAWAEGGRQPCCTEPGQLCDTQLSAAAILMGNAGQSLMKVPWISCNGSSQNAPPVISGEMRAAVGSAPPPAAVSPCARCQVSSAECHLCMDTRPHGAEMSCRRTAAACHNKACFRSHKRLWKSGIIMKTSPQAAPRERQSLKDPE